MKAEIQIRTMLEHAWASFSHEHAYKGAFKLPARLERELAGVAAILEAADSTLRRTKDQLDKYVSSYGAFLSRNEIEREIELQETVLEESPDDYQVAHKVGKLAIEMGDWKKACDVLLKYEKYRYQPILRDLGIALCKAYKKSSDSPEFKKGRTLLEKAVETDPSDVDAIASLAGTYKGVDDEKAAALYKTGFGIDPSDSYSLGNYIEYEVVKRQDPSIVEIFDCAIQLAIDMCLGKVEVEMNYPWVFYNLGKLYLLSGKTNESIVAYARAIDTSTAPFMIETSLESLIRLRQAFQDPKEWKWAVNLLRMGSVVKFNDERHRNELEEERSGILSKLKEPVTIVAGSTADTIEADVSSCRELLSETFENKSATIISGGTKSGVCMLIGDVQEANPSLRTIGYLPDSLPTGIEPDKRYSEFVLTKGDSFSPGQPIQYWIDLIALGIDPSSVRVLGVGGGSISAIEYRIAIALGAKVAFLECPGVALKTNGYNFIWPIDDRVKNISRPGIS